MKSAELNEQNYQFKTKVNMKTKTSILTLTKAFFILLVSCCFFSCEKSRPSTIKEIEIVTTIEKSNYPEKGRYWVVAENYNFFTNVHYNIGDTLFIK